MTAAIQKPKEKARAIFAGKDALKVCVVTHYFAAHGGGIEIVADRLIRELAPDPRFHFTWAASDSDTAPIMDNVSILPMRSSNLFEKLLGFPWPLWGPRSLQALRKVIQRSDVVWLHDTLYLGNIIAFLAARAYRKPVMIAQHIAPIPYRNPLLRWTMGLADRLITARLLVRANEVVFISDRVAEDYYKRVKFTQSIKIVPNGVDLRVFHPAIAENRRFLRQQFALKAEQPVALFVGRFVEKKGLDVLRRLAEQLPEWRFWLAGNGRIDPTKWLLPNVHVMSNRKGSSLAELYQAADVLLIPSYGEGFPLVIQEAMACGLPVLCGPSTAQGNVPAMPHLHLADVWPTDPERTALAWLEKLRSFPVKLPLKKPQQDLVAFAQGAWDWTPIAHIYGELLRGLCKKP